MRKMVRCIILGTLGVALWLPFQATAESINIGFVPITSNSGQQNAVAAQLGLTVEMSTNLSFLGMAAFTFTNTGSITSNVAEFYWGWHDLPGNLLDPGEGFEYYDPTADFWTLDPPDSVSPPNLGGSFTADAAADGDAAGDTSGNLLQNGLWNNEQGVTFYIAFSDDVDEEDRWESLKSVLLSNDQWLDVGMHVRSIGTSGESDKFVSLPGVLTNAPEPVPVPGAAGLGLLGMALVGVLRRKKSATLA